MVVDDEAELANAINDGKIAYLRKEITAAAGGSIKKPDLWRESHAVAVARLLEAHGPLQDLERTEQAACFHLPT